MKRIMFKKSKQLITFTNQYTRGITWSYEALDSLVFKLCNVYNSKESNSSYDNVMIMSYEELNSLLLYAI